MSNRPRYSGQYRTGTCICGHTWEEHHLSLVQNKEYFEDTGEAYIPGECEAYGFNEVGGMKWNGKEWEPHCNTYIDKSETEELA